MSPELLEKLPGALLSGGFAYLVSALMIRFHPIPFELKRQTDRLPTHFHDKLDTANVEITVKRMIPFFIAAMIAQLFETNWANLLPAVAAVWAGWQARADLDQAILCPTPRFTNLWTLQRPILIFDIWTVSFAGFFIAMGLLNQG